MKKTKKNFFFAASNIKKYWSKDHPIIFSGDWCFDYKDDLIRFKLDEKVIALYKFCIALVMPTYVARSTLPLYESFY